MWRYERGEKKGREIIALRYIHTEKLLPQPFPSPYIDPSRCSVQQKYVQRISIRLQRLNHEPSSLLPPSLLVFSSFTHRKQQCGPRIRP